METTDARLVADHHLGITFYRVKCGYELEVKQTLSQTETKHPRAYYKCFGHYDLVEFRGLRFPQLGRFDRSPYILQSIGIFGLRWSDPPVSAAPDRWFDDAPLVVMVLLKLQTKFTEQYGLKGELEVLSCLRQKMSAHHPNLLTSLGHSEIIMLLKGNNISQMLCRVSEARNTTDVHEVLGSDQPCTYPVFASSTSFSLISYDLVLDEGNYSAVTGTVMPTIMLRCQPGSTEAVSASLSSAGFGQAVTCYGRDDLMVVSSQSMCIGEFASRILEFRRSWKNRPGMYSIVTVFTRETAGSETIPYDEITGPEMEVPADCQAALERMAAEISPGYWESAVADELAGFASRFACCAADPYVSAQFSDMIEFLDYLTQELADTRSKYEGGEITHAQIMKGIILDQVHAANEALYQRYSGIEAYLEGVPFPPFLSQTGINRIILAAADIPFFVFNDILTHERNGEHWNGFVTFSESLPFQELPGEILLFPTRALLEPVNDWPTISHEISHAAHDVMSFDEREKKAIDGLVETLRSPAFPVPELDDFIYELFAHWFDYSYFFEGQDVEYFIDHLWSGWLKVHAVWRRKPQYLLRSLLVTLWARYEEYVAIKGPKARRAFIKRCMDDMTNRLLATLPTFDAFWESLTKEEPVTVSNLPLLAWYVSGLLSIFRGFERDYLRPELKQRLNETYSELDCHLECLTRGEVICEPIPNPKVLLFKFRDQVYQNPDRCATDSVLALILSLANDYRRRQHHTRRTVGGQ